MTRKQTKILDYFFCNWTRIFWFWWVTKRKRLECSLRTRCVGNFPSTPRGVHCFHMSGSQSYVKGTPHSRADLLPSRRAWTMTSYFPAEPRILNTRTGWNFRRLRSSMQTWVKTISFTIFSIFFNFVSSQLATTCTQIEVNSGRSYQLQNLTTVVRCSELRRNDNFIHHCTFNLYSNLGNGGRPRKSWGTISGAHPPASVWSTWRCKKARDFTSDNTCLNHVHQFFQRNLTLYVQYINLVHLIHERAIPKYCLYLL